MIKPNTTSMNRIFIISGIILILFAIVVSWSIPRGNGDLSIALAAGNDVLAGHLNQPDDWSFSTGGKVWVNQNWGAGVILALANNLLGDTGLLGLKMLLLVLSALFLVLALREIKIPLTTALIVTAVVMISLNIFTLLRPNLFTITLLPLELWLLYKTSERPHLIWLAVLVTIFWANIHAGFIYGLGILGLWTAYKVIPQVFKNKGAGIKDSWPFVAGTLAALLGAGIVTPFGFTNLTFPFMMMNGGSWLTIRDWQPIWAHGMDSFTIGIVNFIVILCIIILLLGLQLAYTLFFARRAVSGNKAPNAGTEPASEANASELTINFFDLAVALVASAMAIFSNRFIVIALIMLAPLLAKQLVWLARFIKIAWILPAVISAATLIYGIFILNDVIRNYDPKNPFINTGLGVLSDRMHYNNAGFDSELARFINKNKISGNVISPWSWEGFLRLNCPQLKVFIGGRAQQIYSEDTLDRYLYITGSNVPAFKGRYLEDILDSIDAHLIIASNSDDSDDLVLSALNCGNWVIIYADDKGLLFANTKWPDTAALVGQFTADKLNFEKFRTKVTSKAAFVFSQPDLWKTQPLADLFKEALNLQPAWLWSYQVLFTFTRSDTKLFEQIIKLMSDQLVYLETMELDRPEAAEILNCRMYLARSLSEYAKVTNNLEVYGQRQTSFQQAKQLYADLLIKWQQALIH